MTYDEITLFWKFLQNKSMLSNYKWFYENHAFDKRSLDTFLDEVDAEDAILTAFDIGGAPTTIFNVKYWQSFNEKWQRTLKEFREKGMEAVPEPTVQCQHCGRVLPRFAFAYSPKGQLHKHCKECESGEWDRQRKEQERIDREKAELERLEQEIAERTANLQKTTKVCGHCGKRKLKSEFAANPSSPDGLDAWCKKCQTAAVNVTNEADKIKEREEASGAVVEDAPEPVAEPVAKTVSEPVVKPATVTAPVKPDKLTAPKLGEHDATLHYKKGQKSITLNSVLSKQIRDGEYTKCYLNPDRQMRQFLIFNRVEGANVTGASSMAQNLLNVNSAEIVRALAARFNLDEGDNYYLHITKNLAPKADVITVEVLLARTREQYARIAEKREDARRKGEDVPEYEDYEERPEPDRPEEVLTTDAHVQEDVPILEFTDFTETLAGLSSPQEVLQKVIDKGLVTERDIAAFLFNKGWELQEPVVVTKLKKFSI